MRHFTLLEIILAVIIIALAGMAAGSIVGAVADHDNRSELLMTRASEINDVAEKITAEYENMATVNLDALKLAVNADQPNGFGTYQVKFNDYIEFADVPDTIGLGDVWSDTASANDANSKYYQTTLKVSISHVNGSETTTMVFTDESKVKQDIEE